MGCDAMFSCVSLWMLIFLLKLEVGKFSHTVRMEAVVSYQTLVTCYNTARHTEEDSSFHTSRCESLKSQNLLRGTTYSSGSAVR
jgi:hypothetical protein